MEKISAIIPTYNEAHNIEAAIDSLNWADELIVVDSFSTDDTVKLAKKKGARILQRAYEYSASQKNWTIPQAKNSWIFLLDADERCKPGLKLEIEGIMQNPKTDFSAFWIKRENYFMGQRVRFSGWQGDRVVRLFKRDECHYEDKRVHAEIIAKGKIGLLKNKIEHYTYKDMDHFVAKMKKYADWSAKDHIKKTGTVGFYHLKFKPMIRFLRHFIVKGGFLDGKVGYEISKIMAKGVKWRYENIIKLRQNT